MKPAHQPRCGQGCSHAASSPLWSLRGWQHPAAASPGKQPLCWPPVQLQSICPAAVLGPNPGNPEYSIADSARVGKWCGQAAKNTIAHLPFSERLLQGKTWSQRWASPRPLTLNSCKTAPGVYDGHSMPGTCSGYFRTSSCTANRIPKHQAVGVKRELLFFKSFLLALFWLSLLPLSLSF